MYARINQTDKTIKQIIFDSVKNFSQNQDEQTELLYLIIEELKETKII